MAAIFTTFFYLLRYIKCTNFRARIIYFLNHLKIGIIFHLPRLYHREYYRCNIRNKITFTTTSEQWRKTKKNEIDELFVYKQFFNLFFKEKYFSYIFYYYFIFFSVMKRATIYKCKRCRLPLASSENVLPHWPSEVTTWPQMLKKMMVCESTEESRMIVKGISCYCTFWGLNSKYERPECPSFILIFN